MSFFGSGQQNTGSTFGGFGNSNTGSTFGNNTNTSGGSLFGGNTSTSGFTGFGSNNNTTSAFGQNKPAFGAPATTSGGSLFGGTTTTSGTFGGGTGFGSSTSTGTGFGANTGGGLFGQNKPVTSTFGTTNTGGSLFGGGNTGSAFGNNTSGNMFSSTNSNTGFGTSNANSAGNAFGGFGSTAVSNNNGTAAPPFNPVSEKDGGTNTTSLYQSITCMDPYKLKSFEELRAEDYAQGRRFGNTNGQAGAFGQSTGFGGFGQTQTSGAGGLFGGTQQSNTAASGSTFGGFGTNTTGGFGSNTSGTGLFGQNKPAGSGLFGNTASSAPSTGFGATTSGGGGGLFGNNNQTQSNLFGGSNTTGGGLFGQQNQQQQQSNLFGSTNTGGGLFGSQQAQQQQNKPFGGFGSSTNTGTGFGSANQGGGLFGSGQQPQQQSGGLFGSSNQNTGGGLFGQQNKPAGGGLFGSATQGNSGGGLFGNNTQNTGGGLFGNNNQNQSGSNLFGGQQQNKPAGTGLFGSNTNTGSGGGLFGGGNQASGSSLFGGQNKPTGGSLFGGSQTGTGGSLFGGANQQQSGSSLFGNANQTGGSLFGNSQQQQQPQNNSLFGNSTNQQQQPNQLHASVTGAPYGNEQLFASLAAPSAPVGPLATPLSGAKAAPKKTPSLMASMRFNSPVYTPRGNGSLGRTAGYGFSYSTYGTPGSAFSGSLTPGASSMLKPTGSFSSALTSRLNKSISMGNLRGDGTPSDRPSLLRQTPGSGSVRKLVIDRSLRTDLFQNRNGVEESTKRGVSFNETSTKRSDAQPSPANALVRTETNETEKEESPRLIRASAQPNGGQPEMAQVPAHTLSTVPENTTILARPGSAPASRQATSTSQSTANTQTNNDIVVGEYFTIPPIRDLKNMSRNQLQHQNGFTVGREGVGRIEFGPCDLTSVPLDEICGNIVRLVPRKATVYQIDADKPPVGKGLNVPSTIYLENSWPRSHGGKRTVHAKEGKEVDKHIARLKRVEGTKFVKYDADTGVWSFKVDHFTTYGLDDDEDEDLTEQVGESSGLSDPPETPGKQRDETTQSIDTSGPEDDTFHFKLRQRSQMSLPGGFEEDGMIDGRESLRPDEGAEDEASDFDETCMEDPFAPSGGPVRAPSPGAIERYHSSITEEETGNVDMEEKEETSPEMPGSFIIGPKMPRSILKQAAIIASPEKLATEPWEEQLQRTMSPRKRDRQALKDLQSPVLRDKEQKESVDNPFNQSIFSQSMLGQSYLATKSAKKGNADQATGSQAFRTSMDIMNSLWANEKSHRKVARGGKAFEKPYLQKTRLPSSADLSQQEVAFHDNIKPTFASNGIMVYAAPGSAPQVSGDMIPAMQPLVGEHKDVRFARFSTPKDINAPTLEGQKLITHIDLKAGSLPYATIDARNVMFAGAASIREDNMPANPSVLENQELAIWKLCSVLFDPVDVSCRSITKDMSQELIESYKDRLQMDGFATFWGDQIGFAVDEGVERAKSPEERAIHLLTKNDIAGACRALFSVKNIRLATLVSQLPGSESSREVMKKQIGAWQKRKDWSEMSDAVRALYSILAGMVYVVPGDDKAAPENRIDSFCIAERFNLSWHQSLALRVLYGGFTCLKDAIKGYCADLDVADSEEAFPATIWYQKTGDDKFANMEDTLIQLCRLFAETTYTDDLFCALNVSGSSVNSRLAWQMASLLHAKQIISLDDDTQAQLTLDFATELEAADSLVDSVWVLLHLPNDFSRHRAITALLHRKANRISDPPIRDEANTFAQLTQELGIPAPLVFAAKALYAKAMGDSLSQAHWLLRAGYLDEAHEVLCVNVGPQAIIERDYENLTRLILEFPEHKPIRWNQCGQVFEHLIQLLRLPYSRKHGYEGERLVRTLKKSLDVMEDDGGSARKTLEQRVALVEMKRVVEDVAREIESGEELWDKGDGPLDRGRRGYSDGVMMLEKYRRAIGQVV